MTGGSGFFVLRYSAPLTVGESQLRDAEVSAGYSRREHLLQTIFMNGNDACWIAASRFHHRVAGHNQIELAAGGQTHGNILRIVGIVAAKIFDHVGEVSAEDPGALRARTVTHIDPQVCVSKAA